MVSAFVQFFEKGNAGKLAKRESGFIFHFPAFYTTPITAFRLGDYKLMRQLNTWRNQTLQCR